MAPKKKWKGNRAKARLISPLLMPSAARLMRSRYEERLQRLIMETLFRVVPRGSEWGCLTGTIFAGQRLIIVACSADGTAAGLCCMLLTPDDLWEMDDDVRGIIERYMSDPGFFTEEPTDEVGD
jgi:hypothetical protein